MSSLGDLVIRTINHAEQRYDTTGDWTLMPEYTDQQGRTWQGRSTIRVSQLGDWRYEFLVALHEQIEMMWCRQHGVTTEQVDAWDLAWPVVGCADAIEGRCHDLEPGDCPDAPYHPGHAFAELVERMVARELGVDWNQYAEACDLAGQDDAISRSS